MKNLKAALITIGVIVGVALAMYIITWILDYFFFIFISGLGIMAICSLFLICKHMLHKEPKQATEPIAENRVFDKGIEVRTDCEAFEAKEYPERCGDCQTDGHYLCSGCRNIADFESMEIEDNQMKYYPKQYEAQRIERERIDLEAEAQAQAWKNDVTDTNVGDRKISSAQSALDFKMYCEAKDEMIGGRDAYKAWDNVNMAFEDFNSHLITLERLQEIVKGYLLYAFEK